MINITYFHILINGELWDWDFIVDNFTREIYFDLINLYYQDEPPEPKRIKIKWIKDSKMFVNPFSCDEKQSGVLRFIPANKKNKY